MAGESAAFWQFGILWQMMATGMLTQGKFVLIDEIMQLTGPPTHTHIQDEGLYVVEGRATFNAGGKQGIVAGPGTFVAIPKLTEHSFKVEEPNSRLLNFYLPAGFEMFLMGVARPAERREPPPQESIAPWLPAPWVASRLNLEYGTQYKYGPHATSPDHMLTEPTPGATVFPIVANINDARLNFYHRNALWGVLASSQDTGGAYSLFEVRSRTGVLHAGRVNTTRDTAVFILTGQMTVSLDGKIQDVDDGALVWIPRDTPYNIQTRSSVAVCLYLQTPGGLEDYIQFVGTATEKASPPPADFEDKTLDAGSISTLHSVLGIREVIVPEYIL